MKKAIILFLSLVLTLSSIFAVSMNVELTTEYPSEAPYFVGTHITEVNVWFEDSGVRIIPSNSTINLEVGSQNITLIKNEDHFTSNNSLYIMDGDLVSNNLLVKLSTPLFANLNSVKIYKVESLDDYVTYDFRGLKSEYNVGQNIDIVLDFNFVNKTLFGLHCFLLSPEVKKSEFDCDGDSCRKTITMPELPNITLKTFCNSKYINQTIPMYLEKDINASRDLNILVVNPAEGVVTNPFTIDFQVKYPNGLPLENNNLELFIDGAEKNVSYSGRDVYSINYLLIPYTNLDENILLLFNNNNYKINLDEDLLPDTWFWVLLFVLIIIFSGILFMILFSLLRKDDLNALILERDTKTDKLKALNRDLLEGQITKAKFNSLSEELQFDIADLNSRIIKLKKITPKEQYKMIKTSNNEPDVNDPSEKLLKMISTTKTPEAKGKSNKKSIFDKIFQEEKKKDDDEDKKELTKAVSSINSSDDSNSDDFDVNSWSK